MKRYLCVLVVLSMCVCFAGCAATPSAEQQACSHFYINEATCLTPANCAECGISFGKLADHKYSEASCTAPATCQTCGVTLGLELGHAYVNSVCVRCGYVGQQQSQQAQQSQQTQTPQKNHIHYYISTVTKQATCAAEGVRTYTCSCGDSYTQPIEKSTIHSWEYATCTIPDTCKNCSTTRGEPKGHSYYSSTGKCSRCDQTNPAVTAALEKCSLKIPSVPTPISYFGYSDKLYSITKVTGVTYKFECNNNCEIKLTVYFSGEKFYDYRGEGQSDSCKVGWKLYDENDAVITSGTFYSPSVKVGETFSNQEEVVLRTWENGKPGAYRLEICNVN